MPQRKYFQDIVPPCPDTDKYILAKGKYGYYWRKKRGSVKPARLNEVMQRSAGITALCNKAAEKMLLLLSPYTRYMALSLAPLRLSGAFKKSYLRSGRLDFSHMKEFVFQEDYPLWKLFIGNVESHCEDGSLTVKVDIGEYCVKKPAKYASGYQVHLLLLYTDPAKDFNILIESEESRIYSFEETTGTCDFSMVLPAADRAWIALLYIGCLLTEGSRSAPRFHLMTVAALSS